MVLYSHKNGAQMKRELQKAATAVPRENDYTERSTDKRE